MLSVTTSGDYVVEHLHGEGAVLVVDETGDVKQGTRSVGVQRQCTGTAGRSENAQVAVCLVYAAHAGRDSGTRDGLALPCEVVTFLDRLRALGVDADRPGRTGRLIPPAARAPGRVAESPQFPPHPAHLVLKHPRPVLPTGPALSDTPSAPANSCTTPSTLQASRT